MILFVLFWFFFISILYCYFGYPACLWFASQIFTRPVKKHPYACKVSVLLAVWNEEDVIEAKIHNLLSLNYPTDNWQILVGSDGSDDRTCEIVQGFQSHRIRLLNFKERRGKMLVLNEMMREATSDVVVFCDARQEYELSAIIELCSNFADPSVGCVSGELIFQDHEGGTAQGVNFYWKYEKVMRSCESSLHSMLGATGAIYAIRRELFEEIPANIILDDMFVPLKIIQKGYRAIFDGEAQAFDHVANDPKEEHRRKTRTLFGNYQIFGVFASLFNPLKSPIAIQLFSHKMLRVIVPFYLIFLLLVNILLWDHAFYLTMLWLQVLFYIMALIGCMARNKKFGTLKFPIRLCQFAYVFCLLNFSALVGFLRFITGSQHVTWNKARKQALK